MSSFAAQSYPIVGIQKRAAEQYHSEPLAGAEWIGVSNQFFVTLVTPLTTKATSVWSTRYEAGKTAKGRKLKVKDVHETAAKTSAAEMMKIVENGKGTDMDAYGKDLSKDQITAVVDYYRSLGK